MEASARRQFWKSRGEAEDWCRGNGREVQGEMGKVREKTKSCDYGPGRTAVLWKEISGWQSVRSEEMMTQVLTAETWVDSTAGKDPHYLFSLSLVRGCICGSVQPLASRRFLQRAGLALSLLSGPAAL